MMSDKLVIVVTGSRAYPSIRLPYSRVQTMLFRLIRESHATRVEVWHGACPHQKESGTRSIDWVVHETIDTLQCRNADGIMVTIAERKFPADWKTHGKSAGSKRNAWMINTAHANQRILDQEVVVAAFPHPTKPSTGTRGCAELARKAGLRVVEDT